MGDDAAPAESALFSLRRIRPLEGKEQTSAQGLRGGGTFGNIGNAFSPPDIPFQDGENRSSRTD